MFELDYNIDDQNVSIDGYGLSPPAFFILEPEAEDAVVDQELYEAEQSVEYPEADSHDVNGDYVNSLDAIRLQTPNRSFSLV